MSFSLVRLGLAALIVGTLAGCGGGGGGGDGGGTTAAGGTAGTAAGPAGTAVITAAAANPAATNTAQNPDQAFNLIAATGTAPVVVQSPPVLYFTVIDSTGKFVPGLKLSDPTGKLPADPACNNANVTAAIAKLITPASSTDTSPSYWQNLISMQRLAANTATEYAVVEGTTDPKPTTSIQNPATATTDPSTRVVGILEEATAGGYYTYRFAMDVSTPLLLADAVAGKNVAATATRVNKVANNGNLAVKDGKTVHRVGLQLCYVDPVSKEVVKVNPTLDFTLGADGLGVPIMGSDGKTPTQARAVVNVANCNECHEKLAVHGQNRVNTNYCAICHNPGSTDYHTNNPVNLPILVHKIHAGKEVLTKDFKVASLTMRATDASGNVTGTAFPQDVRNCTKCHDNTKAAQADNWKSVPSRAACGACHDGIDFSTGKGYTLADYEAGTTATSIGHVGGAKPDDTLCSLCHDSTTIPVYHRTTVASTHNATVKDGVASFQYKITGATIDATTRRVTVSFQVLKDGTAAKLNNTLPLLDGFTGNGPSFYIAYSTAQDGIANPSDWNSGHDGLTLADAMAQANGNTLAGPDTSNTYTLTIAASSTTSRSASHSLAVPADAKMVTAFMAGSFTQTGVTDRGGAVPGIPAMFAATGNTPDGKPNVARRVVFSETKCNTCHDRLGTAPNFHGGNYSIAMCPLCHMPNQGGSTGWAASARVWVHGIHGASKRTVPFTWHAVSKTNNYSQVEYPGVLKNCETCHLPGTYDFSASQYTAVDSAGRTIVDNFLYVQAATGTPNPASATNYVFPQAAPVGSGSYAYGGGTDNLSFKVDGVTNFGTGNSIDPATGTLVAQTTQGSNLVHSPIAASCATCHDSAAALSHITTTGNGSFYRPRATAITVKEQCLFCHGPGKLVPIKTAHNPAWDPTTTPVTRPW